MAEQTNATIHTDPLHYMDASNHATDELLKTFADFKDFTAVTASGMTAGEKFAYWFIKKLKSLSQKWFTHIFLTICLILYSAIGAGIFMALEGPEEKNEINKIQSYQQRLINIRRDFVLNITRTCKDISKNDILDFVSLFEDRLLIYEKSIKDFHKFLGEDGELPAYNKSWGFWNSMLYSATIYSTVGYGHIYPKTASGRIATIIYSIIGIPLFLIVLTDFGKVLTRGLKYYWAVVRRFFCKVKNRRKKNQMKLQSSVRRIPEKLSELETKNGTYCDDQCEVKPSEDPSQPKTGTEVNQCECEINPEEINDNFDLPVSVALALLMLYLFIGAAMFPLVESWTYSESFYFTFISMSTIGLGDFVPSKPMYMITIMFYLIFGLALTSMCINVVQKKINETFKEARKKLGSTIGLTIAEDDTSETETSPTIENSRKPPVIGSIEVI